MPILNPNQIKTVLTEAGLRPKPHENTKGELCTLLENHNLGPEDVLDTLSGLMRCAEQETTRLRAAETALKLNGMLQSDTGVSIPIVNILIRDAEIGSINPILIPRTI